MRYNQQIRLMNTYEEYLDEMHDLDQYPEPDGPGKASQFPQYADYGGDNRDLYGNPTGLENPAEYAE